MITEKDFKPTLIETLSDQHKSILIDFTNNLAERRTETNKEKAKNSWLLPKSKIC